MKEYQVKDVMMDEYVGLKATVEIDGNDYDIAEQVHETEDGIERGGSDCYFFVNDNENPDFSDVFPVEDEDEGRELYNAIIESMIEKYEG
jgi:hypothetical protein